MHVGKFEYFVTSKDKGLQVNFIRYFYLIEDQTVVNKASAGFYHITGGKNISLFAHTDGKNSTQQIFLFCSFMEVKKTCAVTGSQS